MKIACLLKGIFYMDHYKAKNRKIDFRKYYQSLFDFFGDIQVDYFIATYDNIYLEEIKNIYKPIAINIIEYNEHENNLIANNNIILLAIDTFLKNKKEDYDIIIITRPDLKFHTYTIDKLPIDYTQNKIQIMSLNGREKHNNYIEDNFLILKDNLLSYYINALTVRKNIDKSQHYVLGKLYNSNKEICNFFFRNVGVGNTPFYKLEKIKS